MADLTLSAGWDGRGITQGIAATKREVAGLGVAAKSAVGALGIGVGVYESWRGIQKVFQGVVEEATVFERLQNTINRKGGATASTLAAMNAEIGRLASSGSALEDTVIANTLERLIETSGDAAGSVSKLGFALDLATAKHIDYDRAAKITGFLMKGQIDQASRFAPEIKELGQNFGDLKGSVELSEKAFAALASVIGASEAEAGTATGNILRFKRGMSELTENLFKMASGGTGFLDFIGKVGDATNRIADAIERGSKHGGVIGGLLGGAAGSAVEAYLRGTAPSMPFGGGAHRGAGARQNIPQTYFNTQDDPFLFPPVNVTAPRKDKNGRSGGGGMPSWSGFPGEDSFGRARSGFMDDQRGAFGDRQEDAQKWLDDMTSLREKASKDWAMTIQKDNEGVAQSLAGVIEGGITAGYERGFRGLASYAAGTLAQDLFKTLAATIANAIVPGGGAAGGFITGSGGLLSGGSGGASAGAVTASRMRATELRMARLG